MSSHSRLLSTLCLAVAGAVSPAYGQGAVELGGFGGYTQFDNSLGLNDKASGGGRFSIVSGSGWSTFVLEAEGAYAQLGVGASNLRYIPARARLGYSAPIAGNFSLVLAGGGIRNEFNMGGGTAVEWGYTGLAGIRLQMGRFMALRVDAVVDYMANPVNESPTLEKTMNQAVQAGLHFPLWRDKTAPAPKPVRPVVTVAERPAAAPAPAAVAPANPTTSPREDADRDGIADSQDLCANTSAGATVDVQGCQVYRDSDGDGVIDPRDACPATMSGAAIDGKGCPVVADSDNDGVANTVDRCPSTAAGDRVDATGCAIAIARAEADSDNDGVVDSRDRCPNTPAGASADASGCPIVIPRPAAPAEKPVTLRGVTFASGRDALTAGSFAVLDELADQLLAAPSLRLEIGGHTDATGSRVTNLNLSLARAEAVRAYLILRGVPAERLEARGYGPDRPIANNRTAQGRAMNRRVELRRLP